jgi:DNA-directed RNA polymerase
MVLRQLDLEDESRSRGLKRFKDRQRRHLDKKTTGSSVTGVCLIKQCLEPLAVRLGEFLAEANSGRPGRRNIAAKRLTGLDPELIAFIGLRTVINEAMSSSALTKVAQSVGAAVEMEVKLQAFESQHKGLYRKVQRQVAKSSDRRHRHRVLTHVMNKYEVKHEAWPVVDLVHVGCLVVGYVVELTGLFKSKNIRRKNKTQAVIEPTELMAEVCQSLDDRFALASPVNMPMLVPPKEWESPWGGGYLTLPSTLVKTYKRKYLRELLNRDLNRVYSAVNRLQQSAWKINDPVLEVLEQLWEQGSTLGGLPSRDDTPLPAKPEDIGTNKESRREWKREASKVHEANARNISKRMQAAGVLSLAKKFRSESAIYFPYELDFRGRVYAKPHWLNPQGNDLARGLLMASKGKPIGTPEAAGWLAIHGANLFGEDKVSHEERIKWVQAHREQIVAVATDPLENLWWTEADGGDNAVQFLAWCFEWTGFLCDGLRFESALPVSMDGSCNGLQHFSAMLRDEVGGQAVNLTPTDVPADIYQMVADVVTQRLAAGPSTAMSAKWQAFGVDRKITKRAVMTLPYGSTQRSFRVFIEEAVVKKIADGQRNPFGEDLFDATLYLVPILWDAIGEVVVAARQAMDWLKECASILAREGLPITWTTPAGFPVLQSYPETESRQIRTRLGEAMIKPVVATAKPGKLNTRRQRSGIAPNFVHSMDAAALMLCVNLAAPRGVDFFMMIHDSYGTVAADTPALADCLRESFVEMYENHDVLRAFITEAGAILAEGADIPPCPATGSLNLALVHESDFFFS